MHIDKQWWGDFDPPTAIRTTSNILLDQSGEPTKTGFVYDLRYIREMVMVIKADEPATVTLRYGDDPDDLTLATHERTMQGGDSHIRVPLDGLPRFMRPTFNRRTTRNRLLIQVHVTRYAYASNAPFAMELVHNRKPQPERKHTERFAILLPAIRDNNGEFYQHLFDSLTQPTDVFVLKDMMGYGEGHLQALNRAVAQHLDTERHDYSVKMDDDVLLHRGWQDDVLQAFRDIPKLGVCGLDMSHCETGITYMIGGMPQRKMVGATTIGATQFREITCGNVGGMIMVSPAKLMKFIGDIPIVQDNKYPFYADGYYNHQVRKCGYRTGYVICRTPPTPFIPDDPKSYIDDKDAETAQIRGAAMELFR